MDKQNWNKCVLWANKYINIDPSVARPYYLKSIAQYKLGLNSEAQETYKKAIQIDPTEYFAAEFAYILGVPISVISVQFIKPDEGKVLTRSSERLVHVPQLTISPKREGAFLLTTKVYKHYKYIDKYRELYQKNQIVNITNLKNQTLDVTSCGLTRKDLQEHSGYELRFDFYCGDYKLATKFANVK